MKARNRKLVGSLVLLFVAAVLILPWALSGFQLAPPDHDWNAKAIARIRAVETSDDVVFAVMGDSRGGQQVLRQILAELVAQRPSFAVHAGDFVTFGQASEYAEFTRLLRDCPVPLPTVIGNHEILAGGRTRYEDIFGTPYYSFSVGQCLFVVVDDANNRDIDHEQMQWLGGQLKRDFAHKFVFLHVPPFDPRTSEAEAVSDTQPGHCLDSRDSAEAFMRIVRESNVDIVFASHIHGYFDVVRDGVRYIISGGAGAKLHGNDQAHYFHHYLLVTVHGEQVRVEVRRIPAEELEPADSRPSGVDRRAVSPATDQVTNGKKD